jgi:ATP-binding cassette, subfamily F, member 3
MIKVENLSYSFPQKDLYNNISFTLEDGVHCAFIGTNGSGKSTQLDIFIFFLLYETVAPGTQRLLGIN